MAKESVTEELVTAWSWSEDPKCRYFLSAEECFNYFSDEVNISQLNGDEGYIDSELIPKSQLEKQEL